MPVHQRSNARDKVSGTLLIWLPIQEGKEDLNGSIPSENEQ